MLAALDVADSDRQHATKLAASADANEVSQADNKTEETISRVASHTNDTASTARLQHLGITHHEHSCHEWLRHPCSHKELLAQGDAIVKACHAMRLCTAAIAAARIAAVAMQHPGWCLAALQATGIQLERLRMLVKQRHARVDASEPMFSVSAKDFRSLAPERYESPRTTEPEGLKAAVAAMTEPFESCLELLHDMQPNSEETIDAETVVFLSCNLDSMYYVLLDLHLTAGAQPALCSSLTPASACSDGWINPLIAGHVFAPADGFISNCAYHLQLDMWLGERTM